MHKIKRGQLERAHLSKREHSVLQLELRFVSAGYQALADKVSADSSSSIPLLHSIREVWKYCTENC